MTLKVKMFNKKNGQEIDNVEDLQALKMVIEREIEEKFSEYDFKISIYGEIIPFPR